ncbi:MAG: chemotaxis protein CheR [Bacteroidota bacterium]|nr:chemotaxis protein CheR [Bacteroidota bacterium]
MQGTEIGYICPPKMTNDDFARISSFIFKECGIKMPAVKKVMLESRLQKRLKALNYGSFKEYADFVLVKDKHHEEIILMIDAVTTNKTDFFREADHFNYISDQLYHEINQNRQKKYKIWCAGCSSGEEAYTIAVTFEEIGEKTVVDYNILATDICMEVLQKGKTAIYSHDRIEHLPLILKKKYFLKNKDVSNNSVRIIPKIRSKVTFQRLNFMDDFYDVQGPFDIIFCRNVLIYFSKETQENVINKLCTKLSTGGYFFLGHSESITNMNVPLAQVKPTIFRKI